MKLIVISLLGCLVVSQGRVLDDFNSRVVNGSQAKLGEIPFQVSLQNYGGHFCGGSILNSDYVVTAAHCVDGRSATSITVVVGTVNYKNPGQSCKSKEIITHKDYSPARSYENDIALIKVGVPFEFNDNVQPILLPAQSEKIRANSSAIVSGWGRLGGNNQQLPENLQKAQIWIVDQEHCRTVMKSMGQTIHDTQICANDPTTRRGQCQGDSGGPLMVNGKFAGIVSWSIKDPYCASTEYPGVYTRVPEFIDWISEHAV